MSKYSESASRVTYVYDLYKDSFEQGLPNTLHNLMWQVLVNADENNYEGKNLAFSPIYYKNKLMITLCIEGENGHRPTKVVFKENISYDVAFDICNSINEIAFHRDKLTSTKIVASTMQKVD